MKSINLVSLKHPILVLLIVFLCISTILTNLAITFGTPLKVIINEVELNPPGADYGNEWLELYNPTSSSIDLTGWKIYASGGRVYKIPDYTIIAPNSYIIISFKGIFLNNANEYVILKDSRGVTVDQTPTLSDITNNEYTWQRYPNSIDTDTMADWQFRRNTKGLNNGGESISLILSSTSINIGSSVNIRGNISPAHFAFITIQYLHGGSWVDLKTLTTSDGNFATDWTPPGVGSYSLRALLWDGITSNVVELTVSKISTSLSCMASSSKISLRRSISIIGSISPKLSIPLILTLNAPNGSALIRHINTDANGLFNYTFIPDTTGLWSARV
ncbi:MAG: lamin tail domain-containing protein, partial [Candidatus Bathyarchaeia archaeon]